MKEVHNPMSMPDPTLIDHIEEPYIKASIITTTDYIGPIMTLCLGKRENFLNRNIFPAIVWRSFIICLWGNCDRLL